MLLLAALALLLLPLAAVPLVRRRPPVLRVARIVATFIVGGLVAFLVVPDAVRAGGVAAAVALVVGLGAPWLAEWAGARSGPVERWGAVVGLVGLAVHAALDGVALAAGRTEGALAWSVLAHQPPVGIGVFLVLQERAGTSVAWAAIAGMVLATVAGYLAGEALLRALDPVAFGVLLAFVAGALLHVIGHAPGAGGPPTG